MVDGPTTLKCEGGGGGMKVDRVTMLGGNACAWHVLKPCRFDDVPHAQGDRDYWLLTGTPCRPPSQAHTPSLPVSNVIQVQPLSWISTAGDTVTRQRCIPAILVSTRAFEEISAPMHSEHRTVAQC